MKWFGFGLFPTRSSSVMRGQLTGDWEITAEGGRPMAFKLKTRPEEAAGCCFGEGRSAGTDAAAAAEDEEEEEEEEEEEGWALAKREEKSRPPEEAGAGAGTAARAGEGAAGGGAA